MEPVEWRLSRGPIGHFRGVGVRESFSQELLTPSLSLFLSLSLSLCLAVRMKKFHSPINRTISVIEASYF